MQPRQLLKASLAMRHTVQAGGTSSICKPCDSGDSGGALGDDEHVAGGAGVCDVGTGEPYVADAVGADGLEVAARAKIDDSADGGCAHIRYVGDGEDLQSTAVSHCRFSCPRV